MHQGTVCVKDNQPCGSVFLITLPLHQNSNETGSGELVEASETKEETHPFTILLVDDNYDFLKFLSESLARKYHVLKATNGKQALNVLEKEDIDLVVSDIMMPEMDGIELCRYIKNKFEYCHIPVILLTAKRAEESQIEGYNSGADGYISKPCNFSLLYAQIMNCLKRQERKGADFRKQVVFEVDKLEYTSLDETFLQRAIDCVNAHLNDVEFGQAEFVSEMGASRTVLTEKLKSLTGLTPSAFILNVRLTAACKLMDGRSKIRITDLAVAVGFNDPKYFSTCFKKKYGMTPKEYMEQGKA